VSSKVVVEARCRHVRGSHVVPGWGCCQCRCYNGYQRQVCRHCAHAPCYSTEGREGREAEELKPIGGDREALRKWMVEHDESRGDSPRENN
jgi:hypothetical protein